MDSDPKNPADDTPQGRETGDTEGWRRYLDHLLDDARADTFPASDPISLPAELPARNTP